MRLPYLAISFRAPKKKKEKQFVKDAVHQRVETEELTFGSEYRRLVGRFSKSIVDFHSFSRE